MTARLGRSPTCFSARSNSAPKIRAETCGGVSCRAPTRTGVSVPIKRLTDTAVPFGSIQRRLRAARPTKTAPCGSIPTTEGRSSASAVSRNSTSLPALTIPMSELVVPRSIPTTRSDASMIAL